MTAPLLTPPQYPSPVPTPLARGTATGRRLAFSLVLCNGIRYESLETLVIINNTETYQGLETLVIINNTETYQE